MSAPWDEQRLERTRTLRSREPSALTEAERRELDRLFEEMGAAGNASLAPATQRLRSEREAVEAQNEALKALVLRRENLAMRLEQVLTETRAERQAIEQEMNRILSASGTSSSTKP